MRASTPRSTLLLLAVLLVAAPAGAQAPDSVRVERLAALGRLWNAARFLHPWLAYRPIDWDSALAAAVPGVRSATTPDEYAAGISTLLGALDDPATRVLTEAPVGIASANDPDPSSRWAGDRVLVVSMTNYADLVDLTGAATRLASTAARIDSARAIVFDLRRLRPGPAEYVGYVFPASGIVSRLVGGRITGPGVRSRMHSGWKTEGGGAQFYYSAWQTTDGEVFEPAAAGDWRPIAFVVNEGSTLPAVGLALVASGHAALVADGPIAGIGASSVTLPMGEGVRVSLRVGEPIFADGSVGVTPDTIVRDGDALGAAIARAASGRVITRDARPASSMIATPEGSRRYPEMQYPTLPWRLLAAYRIWGVFEYFNPYHHLIEDEWAHVLEDFVPVFEAARDSLEYARAIGAMLERTHDSHVGFGSVAMTAWRGIAPLPVRIRWIEERPVVAGFIDPVADSAGFRPGDVVLAVDGVSADSLIARLAPYQAASTPQALMRYVLLRLGAGPDGSVAHVTVSRGGGPIELSVRRDAVWNRTLFRSGHPGETLRILPGNIGYADLERLTVPMVDSMFRMFANTDAIIFDGRGYPQGTAWSIAPRLTDRAGVPAARFRRPVVTEPRGFEGVGETAGGLEYVFTQYLPPPVSPTYRGRTVLLIDERAISQAEHTGLFLEAANGTTFIGTPTDGANGDVTQFVLPGGIAVSFTGHDVRHADGRQLQRVGLQPDLRVEPTIAGIRAGRDEVLERAIAFLRSGAR